MALEVDLFSQSYEANADLSAKQFYAVKDVAGYKVDLAGAGEKCVGILQNIPKSGEGALVRHLGESKAVADGSGTAIAVGDQLKSDANAKLVKAAANDWALGTALEATTAAAGIISVRLLGPFKAV